MLLVACARAHPDPPTAERIAALAGACRDWEWLAEAASRHGLTPLLRRNLGPAVAAVPEGVRRALDDDSRRIGFRNAVLVAEVARLTGEFDAHGIPSIPLKGPALAVSAYGSPELRQFTDLDVLVRPSDVSAAGTLLVARGFRPQFALTPAEEVALLRTRCQHAFTRESDDLVVDLHWGILPPGFPFAPDVEALLARAETLTLAGRAVRGLCPEDLLLVLGVHGAKHGWSQLNWVCDVAEIVRARAELDWSRLVLEATAHGSRRMLRVGLQLAGELLDAPIPAVVLDAARADRDVAVLATRAVRRWFAPPGPRGWLPEDDRLFLRAMERPSDRLRYCVDQLATPTPQEWALLRLPRRLAALYYVIRPLRLGARYGFGRLRRLYDGDTPG